MSREKVRIGVLGGGFGSVFHWHEHPGCEVGAVADTAPAARDHLMQTYGCSTAYESLEQLLADDSLDAIGVYTPAPDHVRHAVAVMNAGKHVISAVPASLTLEGCHELVETKQRTGMKYMMAETSYYRTGAIRAREVLAQGGFGRIVYSEGEYYHPSIGAAKDGLSVRGGERTWRWGFAPMLYPTHSTGFLVGVTRERLVEVSCYATRGTDEAFVDNVYDNPFDNACALFRTSADTVFRCNVFWNAWNHGERAQWFGTEASLFMESWSGQPYVLRYADGREETEYPSYNGDLPEPMRYDSGHGGSHAFLTHEFVSALLEDREPVIDVYEAVAMTAPGIVAHESALRGGEQLKVPQFDR
jgi:predicted dehydrogenase